jgi:hypothetical protein
VSGRQHRGEFVGGFSFHPVGQQHRAEFQIADAPVEHRTVERVRVLRRERAGAVRSAANLLDIAGAGKHGRSGFG